LEENKTVVGKGGGRRWGNKGPMKKKRKKSRDHIPKVDRKTE